MRFFIAISSAARRSAYRGLIVLLLFNLARPLAAQSIDYAAQAERVSADPAQRRVDSVRAEHLLRQLKSAIARFDDSVAAPDARAEADSLAKLIDRMAWWLTPFKVEGHAALLARYRDPWNEDEVIEHARTLMVLAHDLVREDYARIAPAIIAGYAVFAERSARYGNIGNALATIQAAREDLADLPGVQETLAKLERQYRAALPAKDPTKTLASRSAP